MPRVNISPEIRAYVKKTEALSDPKRYLAMLKSAPAKYERALKGLGNAQLNRRPAPGKWSIKEIMGHMSDSEMVYGYRYRKVLGEPFSKIIGYDQAAWARALHYRRMPVRPMLEKFKLLRADNLAMIRALSPKERRRYGVHNERGNESIERIAFLLAGHDVNHLRQILAIRKKFDW